MQETTENNIGEYLTVLKRRWPVIVVSVAIAMGIVAAIDLTTTPVYQASAQLLLQSKQSESIFQPSAQVVDPTRAVQNELKIINSLAIRDAVKQANDGRAITISAASGGEDDIIILSATDTDPVVAAEKVNLYAETYQTERLNAIVADLAQSKEVLSQQINDYQKQIDDLNTPLADLDERIKNLPVDSTEYVAAVQERERLNNRIASERDELQTQLNDYQQRLQILQLSERLTTTGGIQILNPATVPSSPVSPKLIRDLVQAAFLGLFIGIGLAFLLDQLDDSVRAPSDVERVSKGLPTLGLIPTDDDWKNRDEPRLTTVTAPMSVTAEAYRGIRTSLQYLALNRQMAVIQLTSANSGEGKTSTVANLAVAFADAGMSVVVIGCDLRRPRIHQFFGVDGSVGLTSVLVGSATLNEAVQQAPNQPNIRVLPSGPRPPNPSELLSLDRTAQVFDALRPSHQIILLDCPPVLPVTDSLVLSRLTDASLVIATAGKTSKRELKQCFERLQQVNSPIVGTILNGVSGEGSYGSLYEYYGIKENKRRRFRKEKADVPRLEPEMVQQAATPVSPAPVPPSPAPAPPAPASTPAPPTVDPATAPAQQVPPPPVVPSGAPTAGPFSAGPGTSNSAVTPPPLPGPGTGANGHFG
jgi:capsular exopolysaccharide synthesis family protein